MKKITEGTIPFHGYETYYRIVGDRNSGKLPLLVLHGGPGMAHDYLESLDVIADGGRAVVYYDQSGCGKSKTLPRPDVWSTSFFEEELVTVRRELHLEKIHLLGQSWGGMLAMQYATHQPQGIASMIVASSPSSMILWQREALRLRSYLPDHMEAALIQADLDGNYDHPEAVKATDEYYRRHVCRLDPQPDFIDRTFAQMGDVYMVMQGPSEFNCTGKIKDWDITKDLHKITIPTLLTSGTDDEATPLIVKTVYDRIPHCRWELIEGGTHFCHAEFAESYNALIESFMAEHE